jgi:hypothetical protein
MYPCFSRVEQSERGHAGFGDGEVSWLLARAEDLVARPYQGGETFVLAMQPALQRLRIQVGIPDRGPDMACGSRDSGCWFEEGDLPCAGRRWIFTSVSSLRCSMP